MLRTTLLSCIGILAFLASPGAASAECGVGDLNQDQTVNVVDLLDLLSQWNAPGGPADLDGDGVVGLTDMLILLSAWGDLDTVAGTFPGFWINGGPSCGIEPPIQIHQYNDDLYILRQSLCTNFEAPFIYLIFGEDKVLMQDTGAGNIPIASTVYDIIDDWLARHDRDSITLVVSHSHGHGDHVAGNGQFIGQPNTIMTGTSASAVRSFFGIQNWPEQIVTYDLGGRIVDVIPIPGHQSAHIALYDRETGILFTGDTLYPGRLYIADFAQYVESIGRLVEFTEGKDTCWVLGTHIEMSSTPGEDFPIGSTHHPDERKLQLTRDHLLELYEAILAMNGDPQYEIHDDFIIFPLGGAVTADQREAGDDCCMRPKTPFDLKRALERNATARR